MAMSMPSMAEVGDGYSLTEHSPLWSCGHCREMFHVERASEYCVHVPLCLQAHVDELHAHNMVARLDDTYRTPRQVGYRRPHVRGNGFGGGRNGDGWADPPPEWLR